MSEEESDPAVAGVDEVLTILHGLEPWMNNAGEAFCRLPCHGDAHYVTTLGSANVVNRVFAICFDRHWAVTERIVTQAIRIIRGQLDAERNPKPDADAMLLQALTAFVRTQQVWIGSASQLLRELTRDENLTSGGIRGQHLPANPTSLGVRLTRLIEAARSEGIVIERPSRLAHERQWYLQLLYVTHDSSMTLPEEDDSLSDESITDMLTGFAANTREEYIG